MEGDPNGRILRLIVSAGIILNMPGGPTNQPPSLLVFCYLQRKVEASVGGYILVRIFFRKVYM